MHLSLLRVFYLHKSWSFIGILLFENVSFRNYAIFHESAVLGLIFFVNLSALND